MEGSQQPLHITTQQEAARAEAYQREMERRRKMAGKSGGKGFSLSPVVVYGFLILVIIGLVVFIVIDKNTEGGLIANKDKKVECEAPKVVEQEDTGVAMIQSGYVVSGTAGTFYRTAAGELYFEPIDSETTAIEGDEYVGTIATPEGLEESSHTFQDYDLDTLKSKSSFPLKIKGYKLDFKNVVYFAKVSVGQQASSSRNYYIVIEDDGNVSVIATALYVDKDGKIEIGKNVATVDDAQYAIQYVGDGGMYVGVVDLKGNVTSVSGEIANIGSKL